MSETLLEVPQGRFDLRRRPHRERSPLRAWDAADVHLLTHLADAGQPTVDARVLIVDDAFGALAVALAESNPTVWLDSVVSAQTMDANRARNAVTDASATVPSTEQPSGPFDLVIIKLPRSTDLLVAMLDAVAGLLAPGGRLFLGGMEKHLLPGVDDLVRTVFGSCERSRAWRKSRVFSAVSVDAAAGGGPRSTRERAVGSEPITVGRAECPSLLDGEVVVHSRPGMFAAGKLDIGTRLLLMHLPDPDPEANVVDLGCGNGVLGTALAVGRSDLRLILIDDSARAIEAAEQTWRHSCGDRPVDLRWTNGCEGIDDGSVDAVVCNPPFHAEGTVDPGIGRWLVGEAHRVLRPGGALTLVANRHLGHHVTMSRAFGAVETIASNRKFVVLQSTR